jgi:hypothetical protein
MTPWAWLAPTKAVFAVEMQGIKNKVIAKNMPSPLFA